MVKEELIQRHYQDAKQKYSKLLRPTREGKLWIIRGAIDVIDDEGGFWDTYTVIIVFLPDYPDSMPLLIETSRKIIRHADWHISKEGICCLSTNARMYHGLSGNINLLSWLDEFAHPFLANHIYRLKTGSYASTEFPHGKNGIIDGWKKILGFSDSNKVILHLEYMAGKKTLPLNKPCFCGSGKKYKRCYVLKTKTHRMNVPIIQIIEDINAIRDGYM